MNRLPTIFLTCLAAFSALSFVVGHAATLDVEGGVAQTYRIDVEPLPTVELRIELREYAGESGRLTASRTLEGYRLAAGQSYYLEYEVGQVRTCPTSLGLSHPRTGGPFTAPPDLLHVLCVQRSQDGDVVVRTGASDGPIVSQS